MTKIILSSLLFLSTLAHAGLTFSSQVIELGEVSVSSWVSESIVVTTDEPVRFQFYTQCPATFRITSLCPNSLEAGESCAIDVDFAPRIPGRTYCEVRFETSRGEYKTVIIKAYGVRSI